MDEPTLIERLARYLAIMKAGEGTEVPPWTDQVEQAATILALIKDPDPAMEAEGDGHVWRAMVDAALRGRWALTAALGGTAEAPPAGADEEGELPLDPSHMPENEPSSWVAIGRKDR
jgi:hypothetical protein